MVDNLVLISAISTGYAGLFGSCVAIAGMLGQRVSRLEHTTDEGFRDVSARVERLKDMTDARFDKVDERFNRIDERFDRLEAKLDKRFDHIEDTMTAMRAAIGGLDSRLSTVETRLYGLTA